MGSETPLPYKLPIIDFSSVRPETTEWGSVRGKVRQALEEFGCFEAVFDKVHLDTRRVIFEALKELFDLPLQTKSSNVSQKPFHGYVGQFSAIPLYESMGIDDAVVNEKVENFAKIFWPQGNPNFSKTIHLYSKQLSELDQIVRKMILESLGVEKYMEEHMESTNYLLRVMKYKEPQTTETEVGLLGHTDMNMLTILHQNQIDGLEVRTKDGHWISLKPSPDSFVVITGDSFHAWTNGRLHSPYHRVMMSGNETRYSTGLFSIPKGGYIVKAPEELVDEEHPLLFNPFDYVDFLAFYYSDTSKGAQSALKAYCGV